jgi:predicted metalloprotease with PDZ domain
MGNSSSSIEVPGGGSDGYCVLQVHDNSPGSAAGLEPFFDYIIAVNGVRLVREEERGEWGEWER